MLTGRVVASQTGSEVIATVEVSEPASEFAPHPFVVDTGFSDYLVRRVGDLDSYGGLTTKVRIALVDGSTIECWQGHMDVRIQGRVRRQLRCIYVGPRNLIGIRFLEGAEIQGVVEVDQDLTVTVPDEWFKRPLA